MSPAILGELVLLLLWQRALHSVALTPPPRFGEAKPVIPLLLEALAAHPDLQYPCDTDTVPQGHMYNIILVANHTQLCIGDSFQSLGY